jgi:NADH:ubiquinone reductase (non-electrogenic)
LNDGNEICYGLSIWVAGNGLLALMLQVNDALGDKQAQEQKVARSRVTINPWMRAMGGSGNILAFGDCSCIVQGGQQLPSTAQVASQQGKYLALLMNQKFNFSPARIILLLLFFLSLSYLSVSPSFLFLSKFNATSI